VVAVGSDAVVVDALGTQLRAQPGVQRHVVGDAVSLLLRPEAIAIDADPDAGPLTGTVISHAFLGEKIEYLVRCGDTTLQVVRYNAGSGDVIADGVAVSLHPTAATLLAGASR
jgi:ABC-type Fe3+/spermidine/putrescine transport system ATPase subunit